MKRRQFIALAVWTAFASRVRADSSVVGSVNTLRKRDIRLSLEKVRQLLADARAGKKPLLVLVIPTKNRSTDWERGVAWGELLNHGPDVDLQRFIPFNLVCLTVGEMGELGISAEERDWTVRFDGSEVRSFSTKLNDYPETRDLLRGDVKKEEAAYRVRRQQLGKLMQQVADRYPLTPGRVAEDAARVRQLYTRRDPPLGSHWGQRGGCGGYIEETTAEYKARIASKQAKQEGSGIACGMGHVPEKSRRFLDFATQDYWMDGIDYIEPAEPNKT